MMQFSNLNRFVGALVIAVAFSGSAFALADDIANVLVEPDRLFDDSDEDRTRFLTVGMAQATYGLYLVGQDPNKWRFNVGSDFTLISLGPNAIWRFGVGLGGISDGGNSIGWRLVQTNYEAFTALEWRFWEGLFYAGYRHRCRHGSDGQLVTRIIMRSGPEFGYNAFLKWGRAHLIWNTGLQLLVFGQNKDLTFHPITFLSSTAQFEYALSEPIQVFATTGLGLTVVGRDLSAGEDGSGNYSMLTQKDDFHAVGSLGSSLGIIFQGTAGQLFVYLGLHRDADSGFGKTWTPQGMALSFSMQFIL